MKISKSQLKQIIKEELDMAQVDQAGEHLLDLAGEVSVLASRADSDMKDALLDLQGRLEAIVGMLR